MSKIYRIAATWDAEASVWVAESDDVPGLATEAATIEELLDKLHVMIPDLLEMNDGLGDLQEVPFELLATARGSIPRAA